MRSTRAGGARSTRSSTSATAWRRTSTELCARAGELALLGVPVFLFQEGGDARRERAFREIARLTKGAYLPLRSRLGAPAARAADRGRGLRRGRPQGAAGAERQARRRRRAAAARAAQPRGGRAPDALSHPRTGRARCWAPRHARVSRSANPANVARRMRIGAGSVALLAAGAAVHARARRPSRCRWRMFGSWLIWGTHDAAVARRRRQRAPLAGPDLAHRDRPSGDGARPRHRRDARARAQGHVRRPRYRQTSAPPISGFSGRTAATPIRSRRSSSRPTSIASIPTWREDMARGESDMSRGPDGRMTRGGGAGNSGPASPAPTRRISAARIAS